MKELSIVENPLADNRLKKMAAQKTTKSVLEYIRLNCVKATSPAVEMKNGGGKKGKQSQHDQEADELADRMTVMAINETNPEVIVYASGRAQQILLNLFSLYFTFIFQKKFGFCIGLIGLHLE